MMRIVSQRKLREFYENAEYADAKVPLERWYQIVSEAHWSGFTEMKRDSQAI